MKQAALFVVAMQALLVHAQAAFITIPARNVWCVSSQPVRIEPDRGSVRFGDLLFFELYQRIEKSALQGGVKSVGIPYLDSIEEQVPPAAAPAASGTSSQPPTSIAPVPPKYIFRVCVNVPPGTPAPPDNLQVEAMVVPGGKVFASLCDAADEIPCRQVVQKKVQDDLALTTEQLSKLEWHVSTSLNGKADAVSLLTSLMDFSARPLMAGATVPKIPRDKLIIWTEP